MGSFFFASKYFDSMMIENNFKNLYIRPIINKLLGILNGHYDYDRNTNKSALKILLRRNTIKQSGLDKIPEGIIDSHSSPPYEVTEILRRNLSNWKVYADHYDAQLVFALQPFANWITGRKLTETEMAVFDILDNEPSTHWQILATKLNNLYDWYSRELQKVCAKEGILFIDTNRAITEENSEIDTFIDRVHLTDYGNQIMANYIVKKI